MPLEDLLRELSQNEDAHAAFDRWAHAHGLTATEAFAALLGPTADRPAARDMLVCWYEDASHGCSNDSDARAIIALSLLTVHVPGAEVVDALADLLVAEHRAAGVQPPQWISRAREALLRGREAAGRP